MRLTGVCCLCALYFTRLPRTMNYSRRDTRCASCMFVPLCEKIFWFLIYKRFKKSQDIEELAYGPSGALLCI